MSVLINQSGKRQDHLEVQATMVFEITSGISVWTLNHRLGKYPSVACVNEDGKMVYGSVRYLDSNIVEVTFLGPLSGKAFIN